MKKLFQSRTVSLITIVAALISLTAEVALAQEGNFENIIGADYEFRTVVITGPGSSNTVTYCGRQFTEYKAVVGPGGTRVEQRQDVGVGQVGGDLDLAQEPLGAQGCSQVGTQYLDRYFAIMPYVVGEIHRGHAALTDLTVDLVAAGQRGSQVLE